jgi:hypothetical protein
MLLSTAASSQAQALLDISSLPNYCSHEHWGSIDSIGRIPGGFRCDYEQGATPQRGTTLFDLLLEPYLRGLLAGSGVAPGSLGSGSDWKRYKQLEPVLQAYSFSGIYDCTRRGIAALYGFDLLRLSPVQFHELNAAIERNYRQPSSWYALSMQKARFRGLIRPVHPEFYRLQESAGSAAAESALMRTVLRIDPFLDFSTGPGERRKRMIELSGIEPTDTPTWRSFIAWWFDQAARKGAVGIKQLQAYRRNLDFGSGTDTNIRWGDSDPAQIRKRQDWIVHECCRQAHDRKWAHQIHVGTHNLPNSSPLPLAQLAARYPDMKIVMIHCWPFLDEAGTLARQIPNIYIDTCWQPILNPAFFRKAISEWWGYVPVHKITCGHDATTVEMAVGSSLYTREILTEILSRQIQAGRQTVKRIRKAAGDLLYANAQQLYS